MASAAYKTAVVVDAARRRELELKKAWDEAKESSIQNYMQTELTFGSLWWSSTRKAYREEAEFFYENGYWKHDTGPCRYWTYPRSESHRAHYGPSIKTAKRIAAMGDVVPAPSTITLSEDEVQFLRMTAKEDSE